MNYANMLADLGEMDDALESYQHCLEVARDIGDRASEGIVTGNIASVLSELGRNAEARLLFEAANRAHQSHRRLRHRAIVLLNHFRLELSTGQVGAAAALLSELEPLVQELDLVPIETSALMAKADWSLHQADLDGARSLLDCASRMIDEHKLRRLRLQYLHSAGRVAVARGRLPRARKYLNEFDALIREFAIVAPSVSVKHADELRELIEDAETATGRVLYLAEG